MRSIFWTKEVLLFVFILLGSSGFGFGSLLRLSFFHGFLGFSGALGAGFGTLSFLLFDQLLAADEFDKRLFSSIALLPPCTSNAGEAAFAVAETWTDSFEQLVHGLGGH